MHILISPRTKVLANKQFPWKLLIVTGGSASSLVGLSIRQPWADLILEQRKTIEVRSWPTNHRGVLLIHAGKQPDRAADRALGVQLDDRVYGAIIGSCELYDCIQFDESSWEALRDAHLNLGGLCGRRYGWLLRGARRLQQPIPAKGKLGLMRFSNVGAT